MDRIRQIKQIAQKIRRRHPEQRRRPRPPGRHCSTGRHGELGPGAPAAARRRKAPRRRRAARSRPSGVLTPSAPTGRRPQPRAGGAHGQPLRCWPSPASARCSAGSPRSRPRSAGRPEPGARGVHRPRERDRHARPRWDRHRPERRRYRSKRRQAGQPGPVVDTAGRTDRPADRRAGVGRSRRPVLGRGDRLPGSPRGHRARRDLRLPDRADLGPRRAGARSRPAAWSRSTSCRRCSPGSRSA